MRVAIEHREGAPGLPNNQRSYYLDCDIDFSEEEKAVIRRRGLGDHFITIPNGYHAYFDPSEAKRLYALKLAVAAVATLLCLFAAPLSGGHPIPAFGFLGSSIYAVYCLYRFLRPKVVLYQQLTLDDLVKHKRFIVETPSPVRAKEAEDQLFGTIERMKNFLTDSTELSDRSVREF